MRTKVVIMLFRHRMKLNYSVLQKQNWIYVVFGLNIFCVFWCIVLRVYSHPYYVFPWILIENERPVILSLNNHVFWVNLKFTDHRRAILKDLVKFKSSKSLGRDSIRKSDVTDVYIKGVLRIEVNIWLYDIWFMPSTVVGHKEKSKPTRLHNATRSIDIVFKGLSIGRVHGLYHDTYIT